MPNGLLTTATTLAELTGLLEATALSALRCPECDGTITVEGPDLRLMRSAGVRRMGSRGPARLLLRAGVPPRPRSATPDALDIAILDRALSPGELSALRAARTVLVP
jgi:hypothetical protein